MAAYENYEKIDMLECYFVSNRSEPATIQLYFERYPERRQPERKIFKRLLENLTNFGSFSKPKPKLYTKENREMNEVNVLALAAADNKLSNSKISEQCGVPRTSVQRIFKNHKLNSYKYRKVHDIYGNDAERRLEFCHWFINRCEDDNFPLNIMWTDESRVTSNGIFNRQNNRIRSTENPHETLSRVTQGRFGFNV